jgi:pyridoxine 4-dehydrogenase
VYGKVFEIRKIEQADYANPGFLSKFKNRVHGGRVSYTPKADGARRGADASWNPAFSAKELTEAVHDNLRNLGLDALPVVNLRIVFGIHGPAEGSIAAPLSVLAALQREGAVQHIGLSNATPKQIAEGRAIADIVCVQNHYIL